MSKESPDDFYTLLEVDPSIDGKRLRQVWRKLARRWHPDHAGAEATAVFQKLSVAYEVLSDPAARKAYDRRLKAMKPPASRDATSETITHVDDTPRPAPSLMIRRVCGHLTSLRACGIAKPAKDGVIDLFLSKQEAEQGGMISISMWVPVRQEESIIDELFSAWLAVSPDITDGEIILPSVALPNMIHPVRFRIRISVRRC
jgi:curved DNA-binding protein CbpA